MGNVLPEQCFLVLIENTTVFEKSLSLPIGRAVVELYFAMRRYGKNEE